MDGSDELGRAGALFRRNGFVLLEGCFEVQLVLELQRHFLEHYASVEPDSLRERCLEVGPGRFMFTVQLAAPYLDPAVYTSPVILPLVKHLVGDDCIIQSFGVVCAFPGSGPQRVHSDHPPLFVENPPLSTQLLPFAVHLFIPLVDLTSETGTTALWPGSHRQAQGLGGRDDSADSSQNGVETPWTAIGDCYLTDFRLRHRGLPNNSDRPRPLLYIVYSRRWFQDRENFAMQERLAMDQHEFSNLTPEHQHLFQDARPPRDQVPHPS